MNQEDLTPCQQALRALERLAAFAEAGVEQMPSYVQDSWKFESKKALDLLAKFNDILYPPVDEDEMEVLPGLEDYETPNKGE